MTHELKCTGNSNCIKHPKEECTCCNCTVGVSPHEYTFPECPMCFANIDGKCI